MFEKNVKEDLLNRIEALQSEYISFFNNGTTIKDNGKYVIASNNEKLNECCSHIDFFLQDGAEKMALKAPDFDELKFIFLLGIIYNKNSLGNNNEILPTSQCLEDKARYYTLEVEAYKEGKLVKRLSTREINGYQGFTNYDELIQSAKKEKITVNGPKSFKELKEMIINNKQEEISLSVNFKKEKALLEDNTNIKKRTLLKK